MGRALVGLLRAATRWFAIIASLFLSSVNANAGYFDCSVVYDEFDQLMNKQFLIEPDRFVATIRDRLTREQFAKLNLNRFLLHADRKGFGIGIVKTNRNTYGRFLFEWAAPTETDPSLSAFLIEETILFGRVDNGYAPRRLPRIHLNAQFAVDMDNGSVLDVSEPNADVVYLATDDGVYVEAINGAQLQFPTESLCHSVQ